MDDGPPHNQLGGGPGGNFEERQVWVGGGGSEVGLLLVLRAKVLLVLGAARLPHLCVLWHVSQRVGADDVPAEARRHQEEEKTGCGAAD